MKGSSTITAGYPASVPSFAPFSDEDEDELTTVQPATARVGPKVIPFGSTLSPLPLRVRYDLDGKVRLHFKGGPEVPLEKLPDWERRELYRHIQFASSVGRL